MALKLMYITNRDDVARIAEDAGVDRIFVDMEYIGKANRQGGMDTVQSHHTVRDVRTVRAAVTRAQVLVRINPIHEASDKYGSTREEINAVIEAGADMLMLPFFKTVEEVRCFCQTVAGRAKTMLLVETPEAVALIDEILAVPGIDEIHVGLNDLSLALGHRFMFVPLADGTVEMIGKKCIARGIPFGFGGIAALGGGALPGECVIREHHRIGSSGAILSRSFCNLSKVTDLDEIERIFRSGLRDIRLLEEECAQYDADSDYFLENKQIAAEKICRICDGA